MQSIIHGTNEFKNQNPFGNFKVAFNTLPYSSQSGPQSSNPYANAFSSTPITGAFSSNPYANAFSSNPYANAFSSNPYANAQSSNPYANAYSTPTTNTTTNTTTPTTNTTQPTQQTYSDPHINPQTGVWDDNYFNSQQAPDPYAELRNDISSSWDQYLNSLSGTGQYLTDQSNAQRGIADTQWQAGQDTANNQKASSLKDIANTTRNAFQAGNNYLGAMGSADSSAANQYSFAINQQAQKQTGDLNNFVSGQMQQLQSQHDTSILQISQWFAQQQEALKQQIAQGGLQKSQDLNNLSKGILDQAMQATNATKTNTQNQYNALVQWSANNSTNLASLQQNIAGIPQAMGALQTQGNFGRQGAITQYGGAPTNTKDTNIFGF